MKVAHFVGGAVLIEVEGAFPERFLNLCATENLAFWGLQWQNKNKLRVKVSQLDASRTGRLAERVCCTLTVLRRAGLPAFLCRFRKRYALLLGLGLALGTVCLCSRVILTVEVRGNRAVPSAEILMALGRQGVKPGAFGPEVDARQVAQGVLLELKELSFLSVNLHGTRAEVVVRERLPLPEIPDPRVPADIVAAASGIVTHIEVTKGQARVKEGDTVSRGETLISGTVELQPPAYREVEMGSLTVRAGGRVTARTWRTLSAQIPLTAPMKTLTGEEKSRFSLTILGSTINFYGKSGISAPMYDKIRKTKSFTLPGGQTLPLTITRERLRGYTLAPVPIDVEEGEALLRRTLADRLAALIGGGTVVKTDYTAAQSEKALTVTLLAECQEEIGRTVERDS
ncbi:MAG: sporulation protein YqfD [Oscillospiraceae bacterium]